MPLEGLHPVMEGVEKERIPCAVRTGMNSFRQLEDKIIGWFCILGPWYGILSTFYTRWAIIEQVPHAPPFPHSEMDGALFIKSQEQT